MRCGVSGATRDAAAAPRGYRVIVSSDATATRDLELATGATMRAALLAVREAGAGSVLAAAPVGAIGACRDLAGLADTVVCPWQPDPFRAVGEHYRDFRQVNDADAIALLRR